MPPTEDRIRWILEGTDLPRDHFIGKLMPRGGIVTLETLVQQALDKNPELKFYEAEIAAAKAGKSTDAGSLCGG